jgi:hypothetical protein
MKSHIKAFCQQKALLIDLQVRENKYCLPLSAMWRTTSVSGGRV